MPSKTHKPEEIIGELREAEIVLTLDKLILQEVAR